MYKYVTAGHTLNYSGCVTSCPSYLSGRLLLWELLWGALSEPELCRPRLLFLKKGRQPELASGSGAMSCLRSGLGVLFGPNTLSSWGEISFSQHTWRHLASRLTLNTSFSMISSCQGMETAPVLNLL